jgi:hypothetical protein
VSDSVYVEDLYQIWQAGHESLPAIGSDYSSAARQVTRIDDELPTAFASTDYGASVSAVLEPLRVAFDNTSRWSYDTGAALVDTSRHYGETDGVAQELMNKIDERLAATERPHTPLAPHHGPY